MPAHDPGQVHRSAHYSMGTVFEVWIAGGEEGYARQASQALFSEVDRLEGLFSRFNPSSEIGRINRMQPGASALIGADLYACLDIAARICRETGGAFDVACATGLPALRLELVPEGFRLTVADEGGPGGLPAVDLGAIGKGYALDIGMQTLADWGIDHALVQSGTSTAIAVGHAPAAAGWPVRIGGSWEIPGAARILQLQDRAISGSGVEVKGLHIRDPRTGLSAAGHLAAWVSHPRAAEADALSTAFMVMSTEEVRRYCESKPGIQALVIVGPGEAAAWGFDA